MEAAEEEIWEVAALEEYFRVELVAFESLLEPG